METKKMGKKKIFAAIAAVVLVAALTIGATAAYLQDSTDTVSNAFASNKVEVSLSETTGSDYNIIPGTSQTKDPTVIVNATVASYVFLLVDDDTDGLVTYDLADGWTLLYAEDENGTGSAIYYQAVSGSAELGVIANNTVSYDSALTNADMLDEDGNLKTGIALTFKAYAIQQGSFDDVNAAYEALKLTIYQDAGWIVVDEVSDLTEKNVIAAGSYILANDIELSGYLSTSSKTEVTIDLNGYTIDVNGSYIISNGSLTIDDSAEGGTITGGSSSSNGGAITVSSMGTVTLNGGSITGNSSTKNGGAVYVNGGTFIMNGGSITDNSAGTSGYGGGIVAYGTATVEINDGTISGNTAKNGGGIAFYSTSKNGTLTVNGGTITENTATSYGGGVAIYGTGNAFTLNGGTITGNTAGVSGTTNYYVKTSSTFVNNGGTIE